MIEAAGAPPGLRAAVLAAVVPVAVLLTVGTATALFGHRAWSAAEAPFFDQNGRVGIGTSDPEAQLDVKGSLNADGPVFAPRMSFGACLGQTLSLYNYNHWFGIGIPVGASLTSVEPPRAFGRD